MGPALTLPDDNVTVGNKSVYQLQYPVTLEVETTSDTTADANISGTFFKYSEPSTPLQYKNKVTRNACLALHIDSEPDDTIELADANNVSIFDFDKETGLLVLEITTVPFECKILVKNNGVVKYTWNVIPNAQTMEGFHMSDDDVFGGNP